jgi:integrative and conjugative element protein (TIGR02256 family)
LVGQRPGPAPGQEQALAQLRRIAAVDPAFQVLAARHGDGYLDVDVSVDCANLHASAGGIRLRPRERLTIRVPARFPFEIPTVWTPHTRWAGTPHVQWGRFLCLYVSPSVEWNPADGMAGFVQRLVLWLERAAAGELDALGGALHPPVAYPSSDAGLVVVRADAPAADGDVPWLGAGLLRRVNDSRVDLVGWRRLDQPWPVTAAQARLTAGVDDVTAEVKLALAVVLPKPIAFEYPETAAALMRSLSGYGVGAEVLLGLLGIVAETNRDLTSLADQDASRGTATPLYLVVGTPSRGIVGSAERLTHLAVWRLPPLGERIASLARYQFSSHAQLARVGREVMEIGRNWLDSARTAWARVYEARPEIVTRRDAGTAASWLVGRTVLVLGGGALGAPIAEACVRGGARTVLVVDRGVVHPGILVRQPYHDADIGRPKAQVLAERLRLIRPDAEVEPWVCDIAMTLLDEQQPPPNVDLVIDATADRTVRTVLERCRVVDRAAWPAVATVLIGHEASRGIATVSRPGASGGGADILRRLGLAARADTAAFGDLVADFFPDPAPNTLFQPEPGCSDVTFVGSAAEVTGLAGQLLTGVLTAVNDLNQDAAMVAVITRMPASPADSLSTGVWLRWPNDIVVSSADGRHEVRLAAAAVAEMRAEARRGARLRGPRVETGGSLLGGFDDAAGVVWVDEATGPPPDSRLSEVHFQHGTRGVEELIAARRTATARVTAFVGMWHTHPHHEAAPSPTDEEGMHDLVLPIAKAPPRALLLIAGGPERWEPWLAGRSAPDWYARVVERVDSHSSPLPAPAGPAAMRADVHWWPGGYGTEPPEENRHSRRSRWRWWHGWRRTRR